MMTLVEFLARGKRQILQRGWRQGPWTQHPNNYGTCYVEALSSNCRGECGLDDFRRLIGSATHLLARAVGSDFTTEAIQWNAAAGRTKEELLEAYDRAIARARTI